MLKYLAISVLLFSLTGISYAQETKTNYTSGVDFLKTCEKPTPTGQAWCQGFMVGYDQGHTTMSFLTRKDKERQFKVLEHGLVYCPPEGISQNKALAIIINYIKDKTNKDKILYPAGLLASYALSKKFPCQ